MLEGFFNPKSVAVVDASREEGKAGYSIISNLIENNVDFSKLISIGNKVDISELELMEYLADDPETSVILGYLEGVEDGRDFVDMARRVTKKKPLTIAEPGGRVRDLKGGTYSIYSDEILATNWLIHEELVEVMNRRA